MNQKTTEIQSKASNMIAVVIWKKVERDADPDRRSLFLLDGLAPTVLEAVSKSTHKISRSTPWLAIDPQIDGLEAKQLQDTHLFEDSPVRIRNSPFNGPVLIAVREEERSRTRASLGTVSILDAESLQSETELWIEAVSDMRGATLSSDIYTCCKAIIQGMVKSGVVSDLLQFAAVIHEIASEPGKGPHISFANAAPHLRLPMGSLGRLPAPNSNGVSATAFSNALKDAEREAQNAPMLYDQDGRRFDIAAIRKAVDEQRRRPSSDANRPPNSVLDAVQDLLDDSDNLSASEWRPSQQAFCENFDWFFAKLIFVGLRKPKAPKLPERIKQILKNEGREDRITELEETFRVFEEGNDEEARAAAAEVLDTEGDWLTNQDNTIVPKLRAFAHPDVISKQENLLAGLLEGFHTLMAKTMEARQEALIAGHTQTLRLTAPKANSLSTWKNLDEDVHKSLIFELCAARPMLEKVLNFDLGKWLDPSAFQEKKSKKEKQFQIELRWSTDCSEQAEHVVRIEWKPKLNGLGQALPTDLKALRRNFDGSSMARVWPLTTTPTCTGDTSTISLHDTNSFDLPDTHSLTVREQQSEPDFFSLLESSVAECVRQHAVTKCEGEHATRKLRSFQKALADTINILDDDPGDLQASRSVRQLSDSFGELCAAVRPFALNSMGRDNVLRRVCEFGLVTSRDSDATIIPAWHPLRLQERWAKIKRFGDILSEIASAPIFGEGINHEVSEFARMIDRYRLPEVLLVNDRTFQVIDTVGGYGLAVACDHHRSAQTSLEATAEMASDVFLGVVDDYLSLNPHEEANLSTAIYGAESKALPRLLTKGLGDRMAANPELRCELLITHDDSQQVRNIFATQNSMLTERGSPVGDGFLSRLRIGMLPPNRPTADQTSADIDVVLLHDVYMRNSSVEWELRGGSSEDLPSDISLNDWMIPHRPKFEARTGDKKTLKMPLVIAHPPRTLGHFLDLCFLGQRNQPTIASGNRAIPTRIARLEENPGEISKIVEKAHDLGEWVVSVDQMSTRAMLSDLGIEVIRDIPAKGSDHRILVSSRRPSEGLRRRIKTRFSNFGSANAPETAADFADDAIRTVVRVAGQKLLKANRSENAALEIIGLAAATKLIENEAAKSKVNDGIVWLSLDENKGALGLKGKLADALAVKVDLTGSRPSLTIIVVEAKCVASTSLSEEAKGSREQTLNSITALQTRLVDSAQSDPATKRSACRDLLRLLVAKPELDVALPDADDRLLLSESLLNGDTDVVIRGCSVVAVHDKKSDQKSGWPIKLDDAASGWQHILDQDDLSSLMSGMHVCTETNYLFPQAQVTANSDDIVAQDHNQPSFELALNSDNLPSDSSAAPDEQLIDPEPEPTTVAINEDLENEEPARGLKAFPSPIAEHLVEMGGRPEALEGREDVEAEANRMAQALQSALVENGVQADFHDPAYTTTPNGTLVRFRGHKTLTEKAIRSKSSELRTTYGIDVAYVRPGLGWVGVFVAASKRRIVHMSELWTHAEWRSEAPTQNVSLLLGRREDDGGPLWLNLDKSHGDQPQHAPHTLIAGETGSGKGNLLQSILLQLAATNDPKCLRLKLIDPKAGADFFWIADAPHLDGGITATSGEAITVFKNLVTEMNRRYELFGEQKARDIDQYNARTSAENRLPRIVVAHDEIASWMIGSDTYRQSVEAALTDLAMKARAAGIYIILITQRASQDAIPPNIRENLGNRLCLKVASNKGSMLALGEAGAENLLGRGHLAASLSGDNPSGAPFFVAQVPFISEEDLEKFGNLIVQSWQD
ncbi:FtsK/SpoIIIE domain-containing protein [Roseovarius ramblicola]